MNSDRITITFGKSEVGLTYQKEKGYVIVNILDKRSSKQQGSLVDFKKDKGVHKVKRSFILCGDLPSLVADVKIAKNEKNKKVIIFKNFVLDFSNANNQCLDLFIQHCELAMKDESVNMIL